LRVTRPLPPWPWRLLLRRPSRLLRRRLVRAEEVRAVAVVCHRQRSGRLAAVHAFSRGTGLGVLALTDLRVVLAGRRGWIEVARRDVVGSATREGRLGTRALILHTTGGDLVVDGLGRRAARSWRIALGDETAVAPLPGRPPAGLALLAAVPQR
jgi:hypothetical protein